MGLKEVVEIALVVSRQVSQAVFGAVDLLRKCVCGICEAVFSLECGGSLMVAGAGSALDNLCSVVVSECPIADGAPNFRDEFVLLRYGHLECGLVGQLDV